MRLRPLDHGSPAGALPLAALLVLAGGCGAPDTPSSDLEASDTRAGSAAMADTSAQGGWIDLIDDELSAWRGYQRSDLPAGWTVDDGVLAFTPGTDGGDIVTRDAFDDFELELEWRIEPGGNSGVFYRVTEDYEEIWHGAPEMQILDDAVHPDGAQPTTSAGALYALYAPAGDAVKPAGEWNRVRIVARGPRVEHWLNGQQVVAYEAGSEEWRRRVAASKFDEFDGFGEARSGLLGLQDHGDPVWFRSMRVRPLGEGTP